jgi:hypothetical protein
MRHMIFALSVACLASTSAATKPANLSSAEQRRAMYEFARCIVEKHEDTARKFIEAYSDPEAGKDGVFQKLGDPKCLPKTSVGDISTLRASGMIGRFAFAEVFVKRDFASATLDFAGLPLLNHPDAMTMDKYEEGGRLKRDDFAKLVDQSRHDRILSRVGECVSREDPVATRDLLNTEIGSDGERSAMSGLIPVIGRCLSGGQITMKPEHLRGAIALNHYRLHTSKAKSEGPQPSA